MPFFLVPFLVAGILFMVVLTIDLNKRVKKVEAQLAEFRSQTHRVIVSHKEQIELLQQSKTDA